MSAIIPPVVVDTTSTPNIPQDPPTTGATSAQPEPDPNDPESAFNALMDQTYGTGAKDDTSLPAPKDPASTTPEPTPADATKPKEPKAGDTPTKQPEDLEPTAAEATKGSVPIEKLSRALKVRREALDKVKAAEEALTTERQVLDAFAARFERIGVPEAEIVPLLQRLEAAKRGDPAAQQAVLGLVGIQPPAPVTTGISIAEVKALAKQLANSIDPDATLADFEAKHQTTVQARPETTPPAAQPTDSTRATPPAQPPPLDMRSVLDYADSQLDALESAQGKEFVEEAVKRIQPLFKQMVTEHRELGSVVTTQVAKALYRKAQKQVLDEDRQRQRTPPTRVQPSTSTPVVIDPSDPDAEFKRLTLQRYGAVPS